MEELARDALRQGQKRDARQEQADIYQEQLEAYERFLAETTGVTDLSGFEAGGPGWASAAETYPARKIILMPIASSVSQATWSA
ncbi:hypothetical protein JQK82_25130 (plasmid) [Pseudosulfitobacter pseudonitzschiae]|nr:hypothetical protein JQK82_25130 [Pseudosulfitobacter pseudonitzschiae]